MANAGLPHTNSSQFFILTEPQPQLDPEPEPAEGENTSLWVGHLPDEMLASGIDKTESELRRLFSAYGVVAGVSVRRA